MKEAIQKKDQREALGKQRKRDNRNGRAEEKKSLVEEVTQGKK